jgi:hypothetical protein
VNLEIKPVPTETERRAIVEALIAPEAGPAAYRSPWRAAALAELGDGAVAEESGGDAGVVEP